jgi:hypothetical protein
MVQFGDVLARLLNFGATKPPESLFMVYFSPISSYQSSPLICQEARRNLNPTFRSFV